VHSLGKDYEFQLPNPGLMGARLDFRGADEVRSPLASGCTGY